MLWFLAWLLFFDVQLQAEEPQDECDDPTSGTVCTRVRIPIG
jgi:hypothetical protein